MFKNQAFDICRTCIHVGKYIDRIIKELSLPKLEVEKKIIVQNQIKSKLQDDHRMNKVELRRIEVMLDGVLESFVVTPTKAAS